MSEHDSTKTLRAGTLVYQMWCNSASYAEAGELVMTLNVTPGVTRATRQEVPDGMYVAAVINPEYEVPAVIGRINRVAFGWAKRHDVTIVDDDGKPMQF